MRRMLALVGMVACVFVQRPVYAGGDSLAGTYSVDGVNPEGKPYTGVVTIEQYYKIYKVHWAFEPEGEQIGIGVLHDGKLSIAIFLGGPPAIAVCDVKKDTLKCEWATVVAPGIYPETFKRLPKGQHPDPMRSPKRQERHEYEA